MATIIKKEITIHTQDEQFDLNEVVIGTVSSVNFGDKTVKLAIKDIVGNREEIQALSALRGLEVRIILQPVTVTSEDVEVDAESVDEGQLTLIL
jgi:hypothetical protein